VGGLAGFFICFGLFNVQASKQKVRTWMEFYEKSLKIQMVLICFSLP
jgi:hypothetical protein